MISVRQVLEERADGRPRLRTVNEDPSKTVQSDREKGEIQHILRRYSTTGMLDHMRQVDLQFRDVTEFTDLSDALRQAKEAELVFQELPSKVREVFGHDVSRWLDAAHDPEKLEAVRPQLEQLGVMEPLELPVTGPEEGPALPGPEPAPPSP